MGSDRLSAQVQEHSGGIEDVITSVVGLAIITLMFAGFWTTFAKAGLPGWGAIVPFYNVYLMCKIAGKSGWWVLLYLIPCVNLITALIVSIDVARNFGKGTGFGLGLRSCRILLPYPRIQRRALPRQQGVGSVTRPKPKFVSPGAQTLRLTHKRYSLPFYNANMSRVVDHPEEHTP